MTEERRSAEEAEPLIQAVRAAGLYARNWTLPNGHNPARLDVCVAVYDGSDSFLGTIKPGDSQLVAASPWDKKDLPSLRAINAAWARRAAREGA